MLNLQTPPKSVDSFLNQCPVPGRKADPTLLARVARYEHPVLIERIEDKLNLSHDEALDLFDDCKRFLYLCGTTHEPMAPAEAIDECWHNFILFTNDYAAFCQDYFGRFLHHRPFSKQEAVNADGSLTRRTMELAESTFGDLSSNWLYMARAHSCGPGKCGASTNCQDK